MSGSPANDLLTVLSRARSVVRPTASIVERIRRVAFWTAIALPFLYLPMLAVGLDGVLAPVFVGLIACNALALFVGHPYMRE